MAILTIVILMAAVFSGCTENSQKEWKHRQSDLVGLNRIVTLYDGQGRVIKQWEGRFKVEIDGTTASFIVNGKEVKISGTFIIEEK